MSFKAVSESVWFKPAMGAGLTVLCGLLLWSTPLGDEWVNASYDYLFRFVSRSVTNDVALVVMDEESYRQLGQSRTNFWDRNLHTQLLDRLTRDQARLVVFDIHFKSDSDSDTDRALSTAIRRNGRVVLMANLKGPDDENTGQLNLEKATTVPPAPAFAAAALGWGIGYTGASLGGTSRQHWPFGLAWKEPSLARAAANALVNSPTESRQDKWLRYYSETGPWQIISYYRALTNVPTGYFSNKIVFVGNWPQNLDPGENEKDKFCTPYTRWNSRAIGGVALMATTFLNLVQGDWLRRLPAGIECLLLVSTGIAIGGALINLRPGIAFSFGLGVATLSSLLFITLSHFTNYWFPWLIITGGQVPCALACMMFARKPDATIIPERYPGYTTLGEPLGEGAYGKVWLVRDQIRMLHALKEIERSRFNDDSPYAREFNGIYNYKPISNQHPGLLRVEYVYKDDQRGYFFYVMELGDPCDPDWEQKGVAYQALDLDIKFKRSPEGRLPVRECLSIGIALADALDFLHGQGLTHRDIKPANIVFVLGQPKLADIGLVTRIRSNDSENTLIGTEGYMPQNDPPGTPQADIFALGKVLYVISTGKSAKSFSALPTALVAQPEFMRLNEIICKACHPVRHQRFATAAEMLAALQAAYDEYIGAPTKVIQSKPETGNSYSCFISYGQGDKAFADWLCHRLKSKGISCWLDKDQLLPGDDLHESISRGIHHWDKMLLCASKSSLGGSSWWVDGEINRAFLKEQQIMKERSKKVCVLIPLNLDGFLFSADYEDGKKAEIISRVAADFVGWEKDNSRFDHELDKVMRALQADDTGREKPPVSKL